MTKVEPKRGRKSNKLATAIAPKIGTVVHVYGPDSIETYGVVVAVSQLNFVIKAISNLNGGSWMRCGIPLMTNAWSEIPLTETELIVAAAIHGEQREIVMNQLPTQAIPKLISSIEDNDLLYKIAEDEDSPQVNREAALKQLTPAACIWRIIDLCGNPLTHLYLPHIDNPSDEAQTEMVVEVLNDITPDDGRDSTPAVIKAIKSMNVDFLTLLHKSDRLLTYKLKAILKEALAERKTPGTPG